MLRVTLFWRPFVASAAVFWIQIPSDPGLIAGSESRFFQSLKVKNMTNGYEAIWSVSLVFIEFLRNVEESTDTNRTVTFFKPFHIYFCREHEFKGRLRSSKHVLST